MFNCHTFGLRRGTVPIGQSQEGSDGECMHPHPSPHFGRPGEIERERGREREREGKRERERERDREREVNKREDDKVRESGERFRDREIEETIQIEGDT